MFEESTQSQDGKPGWGRGLLEVADGILGFPDEISLTIIVVLAGVLLIYCIVKPLIEYFSSNGTPPGIL